jgi:hypothetical protein
MKTVCKINLWFKIYRSSSSTNRFAIRGRRADTIWVNCDMRHTRYHLSHSMINCLTSTIFIACMQDQCAPFFLHVVVNGPITCMRAQLVQEPKWAGPCLIAWQHAVQRHAAWRGTFVAGVYFASMATVWRLYQWCGIIVRSAIQIGAVKNG